MALFSRRPKADRQQTVPDEPDAAEVAEPELPAPTLPEQTPEAPIPGDETPATATAGRGRGRGIRRHLDVVVPRTRRTRESRPSNRRRTRAAGRRGARRRPRRSPGLRDNVLVRDALAGSARPADAAGAAERRAAAAAGAPVPAGEGRRAGAARGGQGSAARGRDRRRTELHARVQRWCRAAGERPRGRRHRHVGDGLSRCSPSSATCSAGRIRASSSIRRPRRRARCCRATLLERLVDKVDESLTVKTLLAEQRTAATAAAVAEALTRVPLWVAVGGPEGERPGIAEGALPRTDRATRGVLASHRGRGDGPLRPGRAAERRPARGRAAQRRRSLRGRHQPARPWIRLTRDDLAPLLAHRRLTGLDARGVSSYAFINITG